MMRSISFDHAQVTFRELQLHRDAELDVLVYEPRAVTALLVLNGLPWNSAEAATQRGLSELVMMWGLHHRAAGGKFSMEEVEAINLLLQPNAPQWMTPAEAKAATAARLAGTQAPLWEQAQDRAAA